MSDQIRPCVWASASSLPPPLVTADHLGRISLEPLILGASPLPSLENKAKSIPGTQAF